MSDGTPTSPSGLLKLSFETGWQMYAENALPLVEELENRVRRLEQENNAPYQCYWRDRALAAEAKLK